MSVYQVMTQVSTALQFVAPAAFGAPALDANQAPPRYVWLPRSDEFKGATGSGVNARQLHNRDADLVAVIHGRTFEECEMMQAALFTALRKVLAGANYVPGKALWPFEQFGHHGVVCRQEITLRSLPLYRVELPTSGPPPQPAPTDQYELVEVESVAITGAGVADP